MYILSQILVMLSDVFLIVSMFNKNKQKIIFNLILSTIVFVFHYVCLSAWTGAVIGVIEIIFLIIMNFLDNKNLPQCKIILSIVTIIATIILSTLTWDYWISLLPMIAIIIYIISMLFKSVVIVKTGTFFRLLLNGAYMVLIKSYFGAGLTIVILVISIIGIVKDYKNKNNNAM